MSTESANETLETLKKIRQINDSILNKIEEFSTITLRSSNIFFGSVGLNEENLKSLQKKTLPISRFLDILGYQHNILSSLESITKDLQIGGGFAVLFLADFGGNTFPGLKFVFGAFTLGSIFRTSLSYGKVKKLDNAIKHSLETPEM